MKTVLLIAVALAALAQDIPPPPVPHNASVSGVVKDSGTGQPLADYTVFTDVRNQQIKTTTDANGRYRLAELPAGDYRISARRGQRFESQVTRRIAVAGQDLENIDFRVVASGSITGRVVDENKEPVPDIWIYLIAREYYLGVTGYFFRGLGKTDDRGEYHLTEVPAGRPYFLMAERRSLKLPPHSEVPLDPKLRRRVPMRTWYPNSPGGEGAEAIVLNPGERRERVDIDIKKSPSYCVSGTLSGSGGPAALNFEIEPLQPSSGSSSGGGMYVAAPAGVTASDGEFRICDLYPGNYRLTAESHSAGPPTFGVAIVTMADRDLRDFKLAAGPGLPLQGEVAWAAEAPDTPVSTKVSIRVYPVLRTFSHGETTDARADIPGAFSFDSLYLDDFSVRTTLNAPGLYVKDVTYAGHSVLYDRLRFGSAMAGAGLRVMVGRDGGTIAARVADKDGNPVPDTHILLMPGEILSEGMLAAALISGQTDQLGMYTSRTLAPGKYYIAATGDEMIPTLESIGKLWRARDHFKPVDLAPNGAAQVSLEPIRID